MGLACAIDVIYLLPSHSTECVDIHFMLARGTKVSVPGNLSTLIDLL